MKQEFTLRTLGVAIGLALAAPALFAQAPVAAPKPVSPPAAVKPAAASVTASWKGFPSMRPSRVPG